ncbi:MAG: magnesium transporter CorA family protein [Candidatus Buchananbacteria bacterium]
MTKTQNIKIKDFNWINIKDADQPEIDYLRRKFKFHQLDLADAYAEKYAQRPKINLHADYIFLVLQFPYYNHSSREVSPAEIDFFIGPDFFITVHNDKLIPLKDFFKSCLADPYYAQQCEIIDPATLLYEILDRLLKYCFPMLDHISLDIEEIEKNIFAGREREMVKEILYIKRNIINFRKIMQAHKSVIREIINLKNKNFYAGSLREYYDNLIDETKNIWDILQNQKETIEALEDTNSSLVSFKLNDIMRTLTIISVLTFPLTLFATIFSMNIISGMPFIETPGGFWLIILIMLLGILGMLGFFRKRSWI